MDSLRGHPEHQGGEEHRHHTKKERDLLPGPNDLGRLPRRREFRQSLLNLHKTHRGVWSVTTRSLMKLSRST